jgi:hypothetical protein
MQNQVYVFNSSFILFFYIGVNNRISKKCSHAFIQKHSEHNQLSLKILNSTTKYNMVPLSLDLDFFLSFLGVLFLLLSSFSSSSRKDASCKPRQLPNLLFNELKFDLLPDILLIEPFLYFI